jgi:hypothetical protein
MHLFRSLSWPPFLFLNLALIAAITLLVPAEQTLGTNLSLIILHGAWVWAGLITFALSSIVALYAFISRKPSQHRLSRALAWTGLFFWLTYLPMSLLVMQLNWGGLFFDEPRWRIPFSFAVVAILGQVGLVLMDRKSLTSAFNLVFGIALWASLLASETILHPESPIAQSQSGRIPFFFAILLGLALVFSAQITSLFMKKAPAVEPADR